MPTSIRRSRIDTHSRALGAVLIASIFLLQAQSAALAAESRVPTVANGGAPSSLAAASAGPHTLFLPMIFGTGTATPPPAQPTQRIYWGALVDGQAPSPEKIAVFDAFEQQSGKKMSILHWGQPWKMNGQFVAFQNQYMDTVRSRGSIPMLDWGSTEAGSGFNHHAFELSNITHGKFHRSFPQWLLSLNEPLMIGETGSLEAADGGALKAEWFQRAFSAAELTQNFPHIKAVVVFDWDDNSELLATLPIDSSPAAIDAFAETIASDKFASNEFAQLGGTVIQPLP